MNRNEHIGRLANEEFDVIVVGGGITGACVAYDASRRGLRVAVLEQEDFGAATSSASSKILHGGIRYLQQARPDKVRESALERIYFQNLVPHLCGYVPFMIPTYAGVSKGKAALFVASIAYYLATLGQNRELCDKAAAVKPAYMVDRNDAAEWVPWLVSDKNVSGALMLQECQMKSSERVTWSLIRGAASYGAVIANYVSAEKLIFDCGTVTGVEARDALGDLPFKVSGKVVANCSGPWIGGLLPNKSRSASGPITAFSRGAHVVLEGESTRCAVALPTKHAIAGVADRGGRHMFMIPWQGHTLVGTSYAAHHDSLRNVQPTEEDIRQLQTGINEAAGQDIVTESRIVHAYAGIYPLIAQDVNSAVYQGTGEYRIIDHSKADSVDGCITVFGAKFTTARILAEKACNLIVRKIGKSVDRCTTRHTPVPTAEFGDLADYLSSMKSRYAAISPDQVERLVQSYGTDAVDILDLAQEQPALGLVIGNSTRILAAEVVFCVRHEMSMHLEDFIFRRSGVGAVGNPGIEVLHSCADLMGSELRWSRARRGLEVEQTLDKFPVRQKSHAATED